jgi:hypothetical protein
MASKAFEWDDSALIPESVEVTIPLAEGKKKKITFYELPRIELVNFIREGVEAKFIKEPETEDEKPTSLGFAVIEELQLKLMCKYLSKLCREVETPEFFLGLAWHPKMINAFAHLLVTINRIEEIIATGGNWLMLPTVHEMLSAAPEESSESQKPTLQVS